MSLSRPDWRTRCKYFVKFLTNESLPWEISVCQKLNGRRPRSLVHWQNLLVMAVHCLRRFDGELTATWFLPPYGPGSYTGNCIHRWHGQIIEWTLLWARHDHTMRQSATSGGTVGRESWDHDCTREATVAFDVLIPRLIVPHLTLLSGPLCARSVLYLPYSRLPIAHTSFYHISALAARTYSRSLVSMFLRRVNYLFCWP